MSQKDLVTRLRERKITEIDWSPSDIMPGSNKGAVLVTDPLCAEAADALTTLAAENERLRFERDRWEAEVTTCRKATRLMIDGLEAERDTLASENVRMREAMADLLPHMVALRKYAPNGEIRRSIDEAMRNAEAALSSPPQERDKT